jgi:hypothetical protein
MMNNTLLLEENHDTQRDYKTFRSFKAACTKAFKKVFGYDEWHGTSVTIERGDGYCKYNSKENAEKILDKTGSVFFGENIEGYKWGFDFDFNAGRIYVFQGVGK